MANDRTLPPWDSPDRDAARPNWQVVESRTAYESPWIRVEDIECIAPTGARKHYGLVRFANRAVGVLPVHDDGTISLVGQKRFPLDAYSWEMPEGGVPYDEDLVEGARRELREECGLIADHLEPILNMDLSNSVTDEVSVVYLATGLRAVECAPDDTEQFEYARVPFNDLLEAVIMGQVRDVMTVAATLRLHHMLTTGAISSPLREKLLASVKA